MCIYNIIEKMYIHIYIYIFNYTYKQSIYMYTYIYVYIIYYICIYIYIYIHTHTDTYIAIYSHIYTYIYTYIHIHTHIYTYVHICTHLIYKYNQRPRAYLGSTLPHGAATPSRGPWSSPDFSCLFFYQLFWDLCRLWLPLGINFGICLVFLGTRVLTMFVDQFCF